MKKVIILSGVSGSGKSFLAQQLIAEHQKKCGGWEPNNVSIGVSADQFFMRDGKYCFDPSKLSEAHAQCFRDYMDALQDPGVYDDRRCSPMQAGEWELIVVDNTNTTNEEISPYYLGAQAFGYECEIITISLSNSYNTALHDEQVNKCAQRNSHGVPIGVILNQSKRLNNRKLPPYWKSSVIEAQF